MDTSTIPQIVYDGVGIKSFRSTIIDTEQFTESKGIIKTNNSIKIADADMFKTNPFELYYFRYGSSYYYFIFDNFQGLKKVSSAEKIGFKTSVEATCNLVQSIYGINPSVSRNMIFRDFNNRTAPLLKRGVSLLNEVQKQKTIAVPVFLSPFVFFDFYKNDMDSFISNMNEISKIYATLITNSEDNYLELEKEQFDCNFNAVTSYYGILETTYRMVETDTNTKQEYLLYMNVRKYFIDK